MPANLNPIYCNYDVLGVTGTSTGVAITCSGPELGEGVLIVRADNPIVNVSVSGVVLPQIADLSTLDGSKGQGGWNYDPIMQALNVRFSFMNGSVVVAADQTAPVISLGNLSLIIHDQAGFAIGNATVMSTSQPSGQAPLSGVTDSSGAVSWTNVLTGPYRIQASISGLVTNSGNAVVAAGQTTSLTIVLAPPPPPPPPPPHGAAPAIPNELISGAVAGTDALILIAYGNKKE